MHSASSLIYGYNLQVISEEKKCSKDFTSYLRKDFYVKIIAAMILANLIIFLSLIVVGGIKRGGTTEVHLLKWAEFNIKCWGSERR